MLVELRARDLGVIADLQILFEPGMTAITGETGAGKTLVVEALGLLLGGRGDASMVRSGCDEAWVEGRFVGLDGTEVVLARVVPASGRPRAYVDGRMAPVSALAERGPMLVELHGQHGHQALLRADGQRAALDEFAGIDRGPVRRANDELRRLRSEMEALGGDERERARSVDLLTHQLNEIDAAGIGSVEEEEELEAEQELLANAAALRAAAEHAYVLLAGSGDGRGASGALDRLGSARAAVARHLPLGEVEARLAALVAELEDVASDLRRRGDSFEEDPARLEEIGERRRLLKDLRRKYGDRIADVLDFARDAHRQLDGLLSAEDRRREVAAEEAGARHALQTAERALGDARRAAASSLAEALEARLTALAMPGARIAVRVGEDPRGDDVELLLGANRGESLLPLAKVASGGELARAMLALRLVLTAAPPTLVFDEVDAGIGGAAAVAVGRALADVARHHQVLVVTHLAQVAAFAAQQVVVRKEVEGGRTVATSSAVAGEERVAELTRMLSGGEVSATGRAHAAELLEEARRAERRSADGTRRSDSVGDNPLRRKP
jgi:DNA repair protein RecN (Recombination protein N)